MRRTLRLTLVALLVGVGTVIGFEFGGRAGYWEGYCAGSNTQELSNAVDATFVLMTLGKGDIDGARNMLEATLDGSISSIRLTSGYSPKLQSFAPSLPHADHTSLLKRIAKYRESHPHEDPAAKEAADWLLARYGTPPQREH
jgi:hypothetical protein